MSLARRRSALLPLWCVLSFAAMAPAQSALEDAKRAYFEGRFEESIQRLEPLSGSLSDPTELAEAAFFLGVNHLALGNDERGRSYFESSVRHEPDFEPSADIFNPNVIGVFRNVRAEMVGRILVTSTPAGADVFIGGRNVGTAPHQGAALAGEQLVRLELRGHAPEERRVSIHAGEDTSVSVTMRPAGAGGPTPSTPTEPASGGGISGKTIGILAAGGGGAAVALAAAGGGGGSGSATGGNEPLPTQASFAVSITPSTVQAQASPDAGFDWLVRFSVDVVESNGLGGHVDFVNVVLRDGRTGATTSAVNFGASEITSRAGTNRIEGRSRLEIPVGVVYNFSSGSPSGNVTVDVQVTDDRGNRQRLSANAVIR